MQRVIVSSGVTKDILRDGYGPSPRRGSTITVHCTGALANPIMKFWSTRDPGQAPFSFSVGLGQVIAGWDEGCLTMRQGEVARLILHPEKGYGASGFPAWGIPPNAELIFEIELLQIQ